MQTEGMVLGPLLPPPPLSLIVLFGGELSQPQIIGEATRIQEQRLHCVKMLNPSSGANSKESGPCLWVVSNSVIHYHIIYTYIRGSGYLRKQCEMFSDDRLYLLTIWIQRAKWREIYI